MIWGFVEGQIYNRRRDIHDRFNGQRQGGIITPSEKKYPIFIITGNIGNSYGYEDCLLPSGIFEYYGEGQKGNMRMSKGNLKILEHVKDGRDLLLFKKKKEGIQYLGQFIHEDYYYKETLDINGQLRQAVIFKLIPMHRLSVIKDDISLNHNKINISQLKKEALEAINYMPKKSKKYISIFERSKIIYRYILSRAQGICEHCQRKAPFYRKNGSPYLEIHHILRLTDGGPDHPYKMIAVCPNCHRRAHSGMDSKSVNKQMEKTVFEKENI